MERHLSVGMRGERFDGRSFDRARVWDRGSSDEPRLVELRVHLRQSPKGFSPLIWILVQHHVDALQELLDVGLIGGY
jgi:hypothetical protein